MRTFISKSILTQAVCRSIYRYHLVAIGLVVSIVHAETVTDMAGRTINIPQKVERILLGEGRLIQAIAVLEGDQPFARIVGWQGDFKKLDPQTYQVYQEKFPEIDRVPLIGNTTPESISPEKVLTLKPDIAILGVSGHGPSTESELVKQLEKSGVPVVFIDFRTAPLKNTIPSMRLLGKVLQREAKAEAYITFYEAELKKVTDVVAKIQTDHKPKVFIELKAGTAEDCCGTAGNGNMGDFIDIAGGINIAKALLPAALGTVNLEKIIATNPDVYIASGSITPGLQRAGIPFGMKTTVAQAQAGLKSVLNRKGISTLPAVKNSKVHGIWHTYYNSPYNIIAIQNFAKWFYPNEFKALDPAETLKTLHANFLSIPVTGIFWNSLD